MKKCIKLEGAAAARIMEIRQAQNMAKNEICGELKATLARLDAKMEETNNRIEAQIKSVLSDTDFSEVPIENLAFDPSYFEDFGVVYAKNEPTPTIQDILSAIFSGDREKMKDAGFTDPRSTDTMSFEVVNEQNLQDSWNRSPA